MSGQGEDRQRRGGRFVLVAVALVTVALALSAIPGRPTPTRTTVTATATAPSSSPAPLEETRLPAPEVERRPAARPPARELRRVARRFLGGYLAHAYGRRPVRRIDGAARALRRRLLHDARHRPRRHGRAARRGRVRSLRVGAYVPDARAWQVRARITDDRNAVGYRVELLLGRRDGWLVVVSIGSVD